MAKKNRQTQPGMLKETNYKSIYNYSQNLKDYIAANGIPLGLRWFPYFIKMDLGSTVKGLGRLKKDTTCSRIYCVLGIGPNETTSELEFKVSFLGLDADGNVDSRHYSGTAPFIDGEETWPDADVITDPRVGLPPPPGLKKESK